MSFAALCGQGFFGRKKKGVFTRRDEGGKVHAGGATDFNDLETKGNVFVKTRTMALMAQAERSFGSRCRRNSL